MKEKKDHVKCYKETLRLLKKLLDGNSFIDIKSRIEEYLWMPFLSMPGEQKTNVHREIFGIKLYPPKGRHWAFSQENLNIAISRKLARLRCLNCGAIITNKLKDKNALNVDPLTFKGKFIAF